MSALLVCGLAVAAGGCRKSAPSPVAPGPSAQWLAGKLAAPEGTPRQGGTLVIRIPAEPAMLNRLHDAGADAWATRITLGHVYETLLQVDRDDPASALKPLLARAWTWSEDGLTTTFHLRPGVKFHDGQPLSARDAQAVVDAVLDPKNPSSSLRGDLADLDRCQAKDELTFVCVWRRPSWFGVRNLALNVPLVPASALRGDFDALALNRAPLGTGPFKFESWQTGRAITLSRHAGYWGQKAHLDKVVFRISRDETIATQLLERGDFDLFTGVPPTVWRALERPDPKNAWAWRGYRRVRVAENAYNWIGWNEARPFFADKRLRTAMTLLVPTDAIFEHIALGLEPITTCPFYAPGPNCDPALQAPDSPSRLRYDPERGRALLAELGWRDSDGDGVLDKDGVPFRFTFLIYAHSVSSGRIAPLLQEELRRSGIAMDIERVEWAVYTDRLRKHAFDAVTLGWSTLDVENDLAHHFHSSQRSGGANYVSYVNPALDALLDESRATRDPARRVELNRRIHRTIYEDQVYTFLGARSSLDLVKTRVRGLRPSVTWYRLSEAWLAP